MSAAKKQSPDGERLRRGLVTGIDPKETQGDLPLEKNAKQAKYRKRISLSDRLRSIKIGRWSAAGLITLAALALAVLLITEPWLAPDVSVYTEPSEYEALESATIGVGERYGFGIELGDYEEIRDIEVEDGDILQIVDGGVLALGEYYKTTVSFAVAESQIPPRQYAHTIRIGLADFSAAYDALRSRLRDFFGVEEIQPERSELRILRLYTQEICVSGLESVLETQPQVALGTGDSETIELVL
ncbi:MAG: hypothetical protein Q4B42_05100, partial [Oscillospiraceae bacterium]|nr:hypothetical protein [Oscillospiraceae bacterium]